MEYNTSRRILAKSLLIVLLLLFTFSIKATHMIGGYLSYKHLGANNYEFTVRIYRDCNRGNAAFPDSTEIIIEDLFATFNRSVYGQKGQTIPHLLDSANCIVVPPNVCVEYADYTIVTNLPPIVGGYKMHYRTCCRNSLISNLPSPLNTGYMYNTSIPSMDTLGNSSPFLEESPPVLVCFNEPLSDTIKFKENDGDSLHYELCDIYRKTQTGPARVITFSSPYSSSYPMASNPALAVNASTGVLSGVPNQIGHYVMGICVTEYRDGIPLSTVRLDYQFNVTTCTRLVADMLTQIEDSTRFCKGLQVNFKSESPAATTFLWDFGDTVANDTSSSRHPSYSYSSPGFYTVTLIIDPGSSCSDTVSEVFEVKPYPILNPVVESEYCAKGDTISFSLTGDVPDSAAYRWEFNFSGQKVHSNLESPKMLLKAFPAGAVVVYEATIFKGNCTYSLLDSLLIPSTIQTDFNFDACNGLNVDFVSTTTGHNDLVWDFGDLNTKADTAIGDSVAYSFPSPGFYMVTLTAKQDSGCRDSLKTLIEVFDKVEPEIYYEGLFCFEAQSVNFIAKGNYPNDSQIQWHFDSLANPEYASSREVFGVSWSQPGKHIVSLTVTKNNCSVTVYDTVLISRYNVPVDAGIDQIIDWQQMLNLSGSGGSDFYWWASHPVSISNPFSQSTTVQVPTAGDTIWFYLKVTDKYGCQGIDSLKVFMKPDANEKGYNVITPNGDGRNDYLDLSAFMYDNECAFTVLNRWGSEVYHAEKYDNTWAGINYAGEQLPDGTYYYILFCNRELAVKGPITIIMNDAR